jgi:GNAT superfamily N-acetyltransferase
VIDLVAIEGTDHPGLVEEFHRGLYSEAFSAQAEPLDAWLRALRGEAPYRMFVQLARAEQTIVGGITYELYPRSRCGFVTYMVVASQSRRSGLGRRLLDEATRSLYEQAARAVFGEVNDPRTREGKTHETADEKWQRLERFQRWGARVVEVPYVQPALGAGLERDRGLCLVAFGAQDRSLPGTLVADFYDELYAATEAGPPPCAVTEVIPVRVPLVELRR